MVIVLAVAPEVDGLPRLAAAEELSRIGDVRGVDLRVLLDVTRGRLLDRLERVAPDVLLWIGHGRAGELLMANDVIEAQWLAAQLAGSSVRLAVVATCDSAQRPEGRAALGFADVLPAAGIDTVTMATDVADRAALEYDVALLEAMASGTVLRQAHAVGVAAAARFGGLQDPLLTPADGGMDRSGIRRMADGATDYRLTNTEALLRRMDGKLDDFANRQQQIEVELRVQKDKLDGLVSQVAELRTQVMTLRSAAPEVKREWLVGTAVLLLMVLVILMVLTLRLM